MIEIKNILTKETSHKAQENIESKLNTIKKASDWSNFEVEIGNIIDLTDLYQDNHLNENAIWKNIAKLSIDLYLDYDYYRDFIFLNKHKGEEFDKRLRMLGYEEENGYWISRRRPEKDLVIEYVYNSCLCRSIGKRLTIEQQRNAEEADISDLHNIIRAISNSGDNVGICPFCDFKLTLEETGCRHCEATKEDIASLLENVTETLDKDSGMQTITSPVKELDCYQSVNKVISESLSHDAEILISSSQPESVTALPDQKNTYTPADDCTSGRSLTAGVTSIGDEPIISTIEQTKVKNNLEVKKNKRVKKKNKRDTKTEKYHLDREFFKSESDEKESGKANGMNCTGTSISHVQSPEVGSLSGPSLLLADQPHPRARAIGNPICELEENVRINNAQLENLQYPEPSLVSKSRQQMQLWTCIDCLVDNKMSSSQCIACEKSRFCQHCGLYENIDGGLCAVCVIQKWQCWHSSCASTNFDLDKPYCEKCGLAREAPRVAGESIWQNVNGTSRLVWVCDHCQQINGNRDTFCSRLECFRMRNRDFIWCRHCGFGDSGKWSGTFIKKCKFCDKNLQYF